MDEDEINELYVSLIQELYPWLLKYNIAGDKIIVEDAPEYWGARVEKKDGKFYVVLSRERLKRITRWDAICELLHEIGHIITGYPLKRGRKHTVSGYAEALLSEAVAQLIALFSIYRLREKFNPVEVQKIIESFIKNEIASISLTVLEDCIKELTDVIKSICGSGSKYRELLSELGIEEHREFYGHEVLAILMYAVKKYGDRKMLTFLC